MSRRKSNLVRVILPGSKGTNLLDGGGEFLVLEVMSLPESGDPAYRGHSRDPGATEDENERGVVIVPIDSVGELPGESRMGWFDISRGALVDITT